MKKEIDLEKAVKKLDRNYLESLAVEQIQNKFEELHRLLGEITYAEKHKMPGRKAIFELNFQNRKDELKRINVWDKKYDEAYEKAIKGRYIKSL